MGFMQFSKESSDLKISTDVEKLPVALKDVASDSFAKSSF